MIYDDSMLVSFEYMSLCSEGLLVATSAGSCILLKPDEDKFKKIGEFILETAITSLAVHPSGNTAICSLKNNLIYKVPIETDFSKVCNRVVKKGAN